MRDIKSIMENLVIAALVLMILGMVGIYATVIFLSVMIYAK